MEVVRLFLEKRAETGIIHHSLKVILGVLILLAIGWAVAYFPRFNFGKIFRALFGDKDVDTHVPTVTDSSGAPAGTVMGIEHNVDPFRDKSILVLTNGVKIRLPEGTIDDDVVRVIKTKENVYNVTIESERLTDIFDDAKSGKPAG